MNPLILPGSRDGEAPHRQPSFGPWTRPSLCGLVLAAALVLLAPGAGCRAVQSVADVPGTAVRAVTPGRSGKAPAADPVLVQQNLLRFADEFTNRINSGLGELRRGPSPLEPAELLRLKIALGASTCSIASGSNAVANLLDNP